MPKYLHELTDTELQQRLKAVLDHEKQLARHEYLDIQSNPDKYLPNAHYLSSVDLLSQQYEQHITTLTAHQANRDAQTTDMLDIMYLNMLDVEEVDNSTPERKLKYQKYQEWLIQYLIAANEYARDVFKGKESAAIVEDGSNASPPQDETKHLSGKVNSTPSSPKLSVVLVEYLDEKKRSGEWFEANQSLPKNSQLYTRIVNAFIAYQGDLPLTEYKRHHATAHHELLQHLPKQYTVKKIYRDIPIEDFLEMDIPEQELTGLKVINNSLNALNTIFNFAITAHSLSCVSPFAGMKQKTGKPKIKRLPFSKAHLSQLFLSPEFLTNSHKELWCHWQLLIALFSGARRAESGQLRIGDIHKVDGSFCFNLGDPNLRGNSSKSDNAHRQVPIHSELIKLGL